MSGDTAYDVGGAGHGITDAAVADAAVDDASPHDDVVDTLLVGVVIALFCCASELSWWWC